MKKISSLLFLICLFVLPNLASAIIEDQMAFRHAQPPDLVFKMYPNPLNQGQLHIGCPTDSLKEIYIFNVMGEVVFQIQTQENKLNLTHLNTGIYLVRITQDRITGVQRLVVQKK